MRGTLQDTANFTMAEAGYKHDVIPQSAARPSTAGSSRARRRAARHHPRARRRHVAVETVHRDIAFDAPFEVPLVEAMKAALLAEDPGAEVLPYCLSAAPTTRR